MTLEVLQVPEDIENVEISINYVSTINQWDCNEIIVDNVFAYKIALNVINESQDHKPKSIKECRQRQDWPKCKNAIDVELSSLVKREVFGLIVQTPKDVKPVGYKWVFVRKRNQKNEIVRHKAQLVAQGFM